MRRLLALVLGLLLWSAASAQAQVFYTPGQAGNTQNQEVTSAFNSAVSITLAAPLHTRAHIYNIEARCSNGTAQVTITDAGVQKWSSPPSVVGTTVYTKQFVPGWTGLISQSVVVTLGNCGSGATGTLSVQADIY